MRAEKCRPDRDVALLRELARDAERFALGVKVEPIARFDFDRADALSDKSVQTLDRRSEEFVFARGAGRAHGGENAAACASDLFIRGAGEPELEFVRPVAPVNQVGVAIDQGRRNPAALAIDDAGAVAPRRWKLVLRAYENNSPLVCGYGARLNDSKPPLRRRERRQTGVEPNRVEMVGSVCWNHAAQRLPAADRFMLRPNCPKGKGAA